MQSCMAPPGNNTLCWKSTWMKHKLFQLCFFSRVKKIVKPKLHSFLVIPHQQNPQWPPNNSFQLFPSFSLSFSHVVSQAVSGGSQLVRAGVHDGDAGLLAVGDHAHAHHQPTLRHHGLLSPAAQQAQQEPERSQGQQGSHLIFKHDVARCHEQTSGSVWHYK